MGLNAQAIGPDLVGRGLLLKIGDKRATYYSFK